MSVTRVSNGEDASYKRIELDRWRPNCLSPDICLDELERHEGQHR